MAQVARLDTTWHLWLTRRRWAEFFFYYSLPINITHQYYIFTFLHFINLLLTVHFSNCQDD